MTAFGPDCTVADDAGDTVLHHLARRSYDQEQNPLLVEVMDSVLAAGAQINQRNLEGKTALHIAVDLDVVDFLVSHGADLEARDHSGATPLMLSCSKPDRAALLLTLGARPDTRDFAGRTLLHQALHGYNGRDHLQAVWGLGVELNPNQTDYAGNTVLHELVSRKASQDWDIRKSFEFLLGRGVDPDAVNHAGETVLHLACHHGHSIVADAVATCRPETLELPNHDGRRPIHIAAAASLETVSRLLSVGVDVTATTRRGRTPLHIAASAGHADTVDMLLREMTPAAASTLINTTDRDGVTVLYYACLSGQPECVRLLLHAGAEVKPHSKKLLQACCRVEREASRRPVKAPESTYLPLYYSIPDSDERPGTFAWIANPRHDRFSAGLDEILTLLTSHGLDHDGTDGKDQCTHLEAAVDAVSNNDSLGYTLRCLSKFNPEVVHVEDGEDDGSERGQDKDDVGPEGGQDDGNEGSEAGQDDSNDGSEAGQVNRGDRLEATQALTDFTRRCTEIRHSAATIAFEDDDFIPQVCRDNRVVEKLFVQLLERRELSLLESAVVAVGRTRAFLPNDQGWTLLHALVALGQASLLSRLATPDDVARIDDPAWRTDQQRHAPRYSWHSPIEPLVLAACRREQTNMLVLRALVDEAGASVNAAQMLRIAMNKDCVPDKTPLHVLARAGSWWQAHEALPFVLACHPDLEARDARGRTPLHRAILNSSQYGDHVVGLLIEAGADVNAVVDQDMAVGRSQTSWEESQPGSDCVSMAAAVGDTGLLRLLITHGAKVNAGAVMTAIETENVGVLEVLLAAQETAAAELPQSEPSRRPPSSLEGEDGAYALHLAAAIPRYNATCLETRAAMVRLLLAHGVDPFGTFRASTDGDEVKPDESGEPCTVLHQVLLQNGVIGPFFDLPGLDLEHRNSAGQTVLLAACTKPLTFTRTIWTSCPPAACRDLLGLEESRQESGHHHHEHRKLIPHLLALGASPTALDTQSRSALHLAVTAPTPSHDRPAHLAELTSLLAPLILPSVINLASASGTTPLHMALTVPAKTEHSPSSWQPIYEPLVAALLAAGADPCHVNPLTGEGTLHLIGQAVGRCGAPVSLMRRFAGLGADINLRNLRGETPVFGVLVGGGDRGRNWGRGWAREGQRDWGKVFAGEMSAEEEEVWKVLEEIGVDFGVRDNQGRGLLHVMAAKGEKWVGVYKRLLGMGLDPTAVDDKQRTSVDVAAACQNQAVLGLFEREE